MGKPKGDVPVDGLIRHKDRGGLKYPTNELVAVLMGLKKFVEAMLPHRKAITKPLDNSVKRAVGELMYIPVLVCENYEAEHRKAFLEQLCRKFIQPPLTNRAANITQKL